MLQETVRLAQHRSSSIPRCLTHVGTEGASPKRKVLPVNPLAGIPRLNAEVDVRHERRALSPKEFAKLLTAARNSGISVQCYTGEERARIYTLSFMTGLRKGEIASLKKSNFKLSGKQPIVTVGAAASKHRKKDVLPLHPSLVKELKTWLHGLKKDAVLFPKLGSRKAFKMVQKDLVLAGIPYRTEDGVADFHAIGRHTHITELLRNGATLAEAKELARHSDVRMTMKYAHIGIEDQADALAGLPTPWQDIGRNASDFRGARRHWLTAISSKKKWTQTTEAPQIARLLALIVSQIQRMLKLLTDGGGGNHI